MMPKVCITGSDNIVYPGIESLGGKLMPDILVVDDEIAICRFFKALLEPDTSKVHGVTNSAEAFKMMDEIPMDAVVLDIHLAGKSGIDILNIIKKMNKDIPVIMITGDPSLETVKKALHLGAFDYIEKPLKPEAVARSLKLALDSKKLVDEKRRLENENKLYQEELKKKVLDQTRELEKTQRHLFQMEKMAAIGQIAAGVAHEINNPTGFVGSNLGTMRGYVDDILHVIESYRKILHSCEFHSEFSGRVEELRNVEKEVDIDFILSDILSLLSESEEGVGRIKKIVNDLKAFSHPGSDKPVYASINMNIDMTLNVVWNELKYKVTVEKDYESLPDIACYPQQLSQVFANIFVNAAHAIEKRGTVTIKTRGLKDRIVVTIADTGVGISEQNLSKIFDPFFTTKDVGKGTGLGMHVAYNIIEKHHGDIQVHSKVGEGTTFTIALPIEQP